MCIVVLFALYSKYQKTRHQKKKIYKKSQKIMSSEENSKLKVHNQMAKHIKRLNNNCHIPDLVQAFTNVENGGLNRVLSR